VSQSLVGGLFFWEGGVGNQGLIPTWFDIAVGNVSNIPPLLTTDGLSFVLMQAGILGVITTVLIYVVVVYAESVRVEIPLSHARVKGARAASR